MPSDSSTCDHVEDVLLDYGLYYNACLDNYPREAQASSADKSKPESLIAVYKSRVDLLWESGKVRRGIYVSTSTNEREAYPQTITYGFLDSADEHEGRRRKVERSLQKFSDYVNLQFRREDIHNSPTIRIQFDHQLANTTYAGKANLTIPDKKYTMNLACLSSSEDFEGPEEYIILHQFGHLLGMTHEHPADMPLDTNGMLSF